MRPAPGVRGGDQGEQEIPSRSPFSLHSPTSGALHRCAASKGLATRQTLTAFRMVFPGSPDQRGGQYLLLPKRSVDELLFHILHGEERPKLVGGRPETPVRLSLSCLLSPFSSPAISTALNSTPAPAQVGTAGQHRGPEGSGHRCSGPGRRLLSPGPRLGPSSRLEWVWAPPLSSWDLRRFPAAACPRRDVTHC